MNCVSVYRVGAAGAAGSSYSFGGEVPDADLPGAVRLGWLPLALPDFEAPGVALPRDAWLTAPQAASDGGGRAAVAGGVTAEEPAAELWPPAARATSPRSPALPRVCRRTEF